MKAAAMGVGAVLVAAGVIATLLGSLGWGFLALLAGLALALVRATDEALYRYGGALLGACLGLVLLMPLRREDPPPAARAPAAPPRAVQSPRAVSFDLTEDARRAVFLEVSRARAQASEDALAAYPDADSIRPLNPQKEANRAQRRLRLSEAREEEYRRGIAARHHLTPEQLDAIFREGLAARWPDTPAPPR